MKHFTIIVLFFVTLPILAMSQKKVKTKIEFTVENWTRQEVSLDCVEDPKLSLTTNHIEKNPVLHIFEISEITSFKINGRVQVCVEPGESIVVNVKYLEKPNVEVTFSGNEAVVARNKMIDDVTNLPRIERIKYDPLAAVAVKTLPKEYHQKSLKCLDDCLAIINDPKIKVSDGFRRYLQSQMEAILIIPLLEYPFMHSEVWRKDFEEFVPDDYWTFLDNYVPRKDDFSLRSLNYNFFLMDYKNYLKRVEIKKRGETNFKLSNNTLEQEYKELAECYNGAMRESVLYYFLSNSIMQAKNISVTETLMNDYFKKYKPTKDHKLELQNMMQ